jgi:hypothetical protein
MRPSITRRDLEQRASALVDTLGTIGANLGVTSGEEAVAHAVEPLEARASSSSIAAECGFAIETCCGTTRGRSITCSSPRPAVRISGSARNLTPMFTLLSRSTGLKRLASKYGMKPNGFARRFIAGETIDEAIEVARTLQVGGFHLALDHSARA